MSHRVLLAMLLLFPLIGFAASGCGPAPADSTPPEMTQQEIEEENRKLAEELKKQPR